MRTCRNSLFGLAGSQYDLSKLDMGGLEDRARELEEQQRGKGNSKVMNMIDTCVLALGDPLGIWADLNGET